MIDLFRRSCSSGIHSVQHGLLHYQTE